MYLTYIVPLDIEFERIKSHSLMLLALVADAFVQFMCWGYTVVSSGKLLFSNSSLKNLCSVPLFLLQLITAEQWAFYWCMMSQTSHPSTVSFLLSTHNLFGLTFLVCSVPIFLILLQTLETGFVISNSTLQIMSTKSW